MRTPAQQRDAGLRGAILKVLKSAHKKYTAGIVPGAQVMRDAAYIVGENFESEEHAIDLICELEQMGMIQLFRADKLKGEMLGLRHFKCRLLDPGFQQLDHALPVNLRIDDGRDMPD